MGISLNRLRSTFDNPGAKKLRGAQFPNAPGLQGSFGYVTSTMPNTFPRQIQLALKLFF
jgi:hypothetical protein